MSEPGNDNITPPPRTAYDSVHLSNVAAAIFDRKHPTQIGPYHILELIGQGGMGSVYKAEQREPITRTVALKIIKVGMDTEQVIARFASERQAVALMNHVNVARVLDAGATDSGRPYFVMEYVAGEPITAFADRLRLTLRERLELFIQACNAVEHAHQKGIIHRDLKPSNILVTTQDPGGPGLVKVIDFGIAKAISTPLSERTLFTESGQLLGTPEYMSPEQADPSVVDIDTRTDVYALGVVLYELLSGALPFDAATLRSGGYSEIQRIIREVDPPRPSTRLSGLGPGAQDVARCRQMPLRALEKQLKTEIEWIPLKAMRKERSGRYATASELADDIRNYLESRPLRAGPASATYRARKFLRRNKNAVITAGLVALSLVGGIAATTWQAVRATRAQQNLAGALVQVREQKQQVEDALGTVRRQKKEVENASANVTAVNEFLTQDLLQSADPSITRGEKLTVREALDSAGKNVERKLKDQPLSQATVHYTLALTYDALGRADLGLEHARKALDIRRRVLGNDDPQTVAAINCVIVLLQSQSRLDEAEPLCREAIARARPHFTAEPRLLINALSEMAQLLQARGKSSDAEPFLREAMDAARRAFGNDKPETLTAINNIAALLLSENRAAEAEPLLREVVATQRRQFGSDHPDTLTAIANLAKALQAAGKLEESERLHREALRGMSRVLGGEHPSTLIELRNLGALLQDTGRLDEAATLYRQALAGSRKVLGEDHPDTLGAMNHLASLLLQKLGNLDEAVKLNREVLARCRRTLGDDHPDTIFTLNNLGAALYAQENFEQAEPLLAEAYRRAPTSQLDPASVAYCMSRWGPCLVQLGRFQQAETPLIEAHRRLAETGLGRTDPMRNVLAALVVLCSATNRPAEAAKWRAELAAADAASHPATGKSQ